MGCKQVSSKEDVSKKKKKNQEKNNGVGPEGKENGDKDVEDGVQKLEEEGRKQEGNNLEGKVDPNGDKSAHSIEDKNKNYENEIQYRIKVIHRNNIIWAQIFPQSTAINLIIDQFKNDQKDEELDEEAQFLIDGKVDFQLDQQVIEFSKYANEENEISVMIMDPIGLSNFPDDAFEQLKTGQTFFGKPHLNPFGIILFNKNKKGLDFKSFSQSSIDQYSLNLFSHTSAYCNGNNFLYLSGGERDNQPEGNLWTIDFSDLSISFFTQVMPPKKCHSMVFIPNSYVFIVGGNTRNVLCFDTIKMNLIEWGSLNKDRIEPSLALVDNQYLYAISYTKNNLTFERSNLKKGRPAWKTINPKLDYNVTFTQKFFGIIHQTENELLFFGGCQMNDDSDSKCFMYNHETNELKESNVPFKEVDFMEKTFLNISNKWACLIPSCSFNDMNIILFSLEKREYEIVHFQHDKKTSSNHQNKMPSIVQSLKIDIPQLNLNMPNDPQSQNIINKHDKVQGLIQMN